MVGNGERLSLEREGRSSSAMVCIKLTRHSVNNIIMYVETAGPRIISLFQITYEVDPPFILRTSLG